MSIQIHEVIGAQREQFHDRIAKLEAGVSYPIGDDFFELDHGQNYFAFFDRLGDVWYLAATDNETVVAVGAGILRRIPPRPNTRPEPIWYACDLKVRSSHRSRRIPWQVFCYAVPRKYGLCGRGYGISMNPADGRENPVVRMLNRFGLLPINIGATLLLYSLDTNTMNDVAPILSAARGPLSYLSLQGKKDIVLQSTQKPMPLLHVQFGPCASPGFPNPVAGHIHMFCTPDTDPLVEQLSQHNIRPSATATLIHHRCGDWDWRFVLTSEI